MSENKAALMALVKGVVALSETTRAMAASGEPDDIQLAGMRAKTAQIAAALKELENSAASVVSHGEVLEPMATSASSAPTLEVSSLDDLFD